MAKFLFCNRCQQRYVVSDDTSDYVHQCNAPSSTINNEDMANVGAWTDYTGQGGAVSNLRWLGITNKLAGTRGHLQHGKRLPPLTKRANDAQIFRERQHLHYIDLTE